MAETEKPDLEKATAFLREKWKKTVVCPVCGSTEWQIHNDILRNPLWGSESIGCPMVVVLCANCGHAMLFSAVKTGALAPDPPKSKSGGSENA